MKLPLCSCYEINDSTSLRNCSSPEHACEINELRSSGAYAIAELKIALTCCQRSGVMIIADCRLPIADFYQIGNRQLEIGNPSMRDAHDSPQTPHDNCRRSQARAIFQSRSTVACPILITSAISSIERPPKNFSSTIRLCCGSICANSSNASFNASKSTSGCCASFSAPVNEIRCFAEPPRFTA